MCEEHRNTRSPLSGESAQRIWLQGMFHKMSAIDAPAWGNQGRFRLLAALVIFASIAVAPRAVHALENPPLASVAIDGSTVYSPADFFTTYRYRLGQPATRELAQEIAAAIAELYRADGFARPELRLDQALIGDGVMHINVFEARVTRVTIEGSPGRYRGQIEAIAGRLRDSSPLRRDAIALTLAELRRMPGLSVTATTRRDEATPNAHELVLQAEFAPLTGQARMNNRGTEQAGPLFMAGQVEANDLLGWGEEIGFVVAAASDPGEYLSGALYLDRPLGAAGTRGMAMLFRSQSAPNEQPVNLTDEFARERISIRVTRPLTPAFTLTGAFDADDLIVDRDGAEIRDERLRVLEAGLRSGWHAGRATQFSSVVELRKGLDALGAGLRADDLVDDPRSCDFLLAQWQATSYTRLNELWTIRTDAFAQLSADVLPDSERFKIGGERLGRGFEVAEIAGDHGLGAKVLLRRDLEVAATPIGRPSVYGYYDIGAAWKKDLPGRESAATVGAGIALQGIRLSGYAELARPLTHADVEGNRSTSLFAELSYRF